MLFATLALAAALGDTRTPALRPSAADLSLAVHTANASAPLQWFHGTTATQVQRDAVEEGLVGIAMPRVLRFARDVGCSSSDVGYAFSTYSKITAKLGNLYEAQAMKNGTWNVRPNGNHYSFEYYVEQKIHDCAIDPHRAVKCATLISPDVATYLDVRVDTGRCVAGARVIVAKPIGPYESARGNLGQVDVKNVPTISGGQANLLNAAVADHNALLPATGPARLATEDAATNEAQHHFLRSKDFMSDLDPAWSAAEVMQWHALQNRFMTLWSQKVEAGDWFAARQADSDHQLSHICGAVKDDRFQVLFSCPAGLGRSGSMDRCVPSTCAQALTRFAP